MEKWIWQEYKGMDYINIPEWGELGVNNMFTARNGGYSQGVFTSLNMALHVGDDEINVINNRKKVLNVIDLTLDNMVCIEQVHSANIAIIKEDSLGRGAYNLDNAIKATDAMVTNVPNICLATFYADCLPIYIFDKVERVIGIAHSGWKGTMEQIGVKTINLMKNEFSSKIENIEIFMGPGIHKCCFEIDNKLAEVVNDKFSHFDNILIAKETGFLWDLPNTNRQALLNIGIKKENIIICPLCTSCNTDKFFSYRKEKGNTGRMAALISLAY